MVSDLDIIKNFEGFREEAYPDAGGWAIGYGNQTYPNGTPVKKGDRVTRENAELMLQHTVSGIHQVIDESVNVELTPNQKAALTSFAYNVGTGGLRSSTLLRKLNNGDIEGAANEFSRWNKSQGKVHEGLTKRRNQERSVFLGGEQAGLPSVQKPTQYLPNPTQQTTQQTKPLSQESKTFLSSIKNPTTPLNQLMAEGDKVLQKVYNSSEENIPQATNASSIRQHLRQLGDGITNLNPVPNVNKEEVDTTAEDLVSIDSSIAEQPMDEDVVADVAVQNNVPFEGAMNMIKNVGESIPLEKIGNTALSLAGTVNPMFKALPALLQNKQLVQGTQKLTAQMGAPIAGAMAGAAVGSAIMPGIGTAIGGVAGSFMGGMAGAASNNYIDSGRFSLGTKDIITSGVMAPFIGLGPAAPALRAGYGALRSGVGGNALRIIAGESVGAGTGLKTVLGNATLQGSINVGVDSGAELMTGGGMLSATDSLVSFALGAGIKGGVDVGTMLNAQSAASVVKDLEVKLFGEVPNNNQLVDPNAGLAPEQLDAFTKQIDEAKANRQSDKSLETLSNEDLDTRVKRLQEDRQLINVLEDGTEISKGIQSDIQALKVYENSKVDQLFEAQRAGGATDFIDPKLQKKITETQQNLISKYNTIFPDNPAMAQKAMKKHFQMIEDGTDIAKSRKEVDTQLRKYQTEIQGRQALKAIDDDGVVKQQATLYNQHPIVRTAFTITPEQTLKVAQIANEAKLLPHEQQEFGKLLNQLEIVNTLRTGSVGETNGLLTAMTNENPLLGATANSVYAYLDAQQRIFATNVASGSLDPNTLPPELARVSKARELGYIMSSKVKEVTLPNPVADQITNILGDTVEVSRVGNEYATLSLKGVKEAQTLIKTNQPLVKGLLKDFEETLFRNEVNQNTPLGDDPFSTLSAELDSKRLTLSRTRQSEISKVRNNKKLTESERTKRIASIEEKYQGKIDEAERGVKQAKTLKKLNDAGLTVNRDGSLQIKENMDDALKTANALNMAQSADRYMNNIIQKAYGPEFDFHAPGRLKTYTSHLQEVAMAKNNRLANLDQTSRDISKEISKGKTLKEVLDTNETLRNSILEDIYRYEAELEVKQLDKPEGFLDDLKDAPGLLTDHQKYQLVDNIKRKKLELANSDQKEMDRALGTIIDAHNDNFAKAAAGSGENNVFLNWFQEKWSTRGGMTNNRNIFTASTEQARFMLKRMSQIEKQLRNPDSKVMIKHNNSMVEAKLNDMDKRTLSAKGLAWDQKVITNMMTSSNLMPNLNAGLRSTSSSVQDAFQTYRRLSNSIAAGVLRSPFANAVQQWGDDVSIRRNYAALMRQELGSNKRAFGVNTISPSQKEFIREAGYDLHQWDSRTKNRLREARDEMVQESKGLDSLSTTQNDMPKDRPQESVLGMAISATYKANAQIQYNQMAQDAIVMADDYIAKNLPNATPLQRRKIFDSFLYDLADRSKQGMRAFLAPGIVGGNRIINVTDPRQWYLALDGTSDALMNNMSVPSWVRYPVGIGMKLLNDSSFRFTGFYSEVLGKHVGVLKAGLKKYKTLANTNQQGELLTEMSKDLGGYALTASIYSANSFFPTSLFSMFTGLVGIMSGQHTEEDLKDYVTKQSIWSDFFDMEKFDGSPAGVASQVLGNGDTVRLALAIGSIGKDQPNDNPTYHLGKTVPARAKDAYMHGFGLLRKATDSTLTKEQQLQHLRDGVVTLIHPGMLNNLKDMAAYNQTAVRSPRKYSTEELDNGRYNPNELLWMDEETRTKFEEDIWFRTKLHVGGLLGLNNKPTMEYFDSKAIEIQRGFLPTDSDEDVLQKVNNALAGRQKVSQTLESL